MKKYTTEQKLEKARARILRAAEEWEELNTIPCNGWKNWKTWIVACYLSDVETNYRLARAWSQANPEKTYKQFIKELGWKLENLDPKKVSWNARTLDFDALTQFLQEYIAAA